MDDIAPPDDLLARSGPLDLAGLAWDDVPRHPLPEGALRVLRYMQDIETHTLVYARTLLGTRAIDDPDVSTFLACWLYEETGHGRALARFLHVAGAAPVARTRSRMPLAARAEERLTRTVARAWPGFLAVHMTWGAINELTTLAAYRRLAARAAHPVLAELLRRIARQEARHAAFYHAEAARRLARPGAARVARLLVDRFWAPVGSGVQPDGEVRFLARWLFGGRDGRAAAARVDAVVRRLPGFADASLLGGWLARAGTDAPSPVDVPAGYALPASAPPGVS